MELYFNLNAGVLSLHNAFVYLHFVTTFRLLLEVIFELTRHRICKYVGPLQSELTANSTAAAAFLFNESLAVAYICLHYVFYMT